MQPHRAPLAVALLLALVAAGGCGAKAKPPLDIQKKYPTLPPKPVPPWMRGTLYEQIDVGNLRPVVISGFGVVVNLHNTGSDAGVPTRVRSYITNEMAKRGVGNAAQSGFERLSPEEMINDDRVSVVRADALVPAGTRKGDPLDVQVSVLPQGQTKSLAHGHLWRCDLGSTGGLADSPDVIEPAALAEGPVFANPAYALDPDLDDTAQVTSLRSGLVIGGARALRDNPIALRVRSAQWGASRSVEQRLNLAFRTPDLAAAQDEGVVLVDVPPAYRRDADRFVNVLLHTYFEFDTRFAAVKAQQLAAEAQRPGAALANLTYAFEALGAPALPAVQPLIAHRDPAVAFAAARAAACLGDASGRRALADLARVPDGPYSLNAARALARLELSADVADHLRALLASPDALVRVEAYKGLVAGGDRSIYTKDAGGKFKLDLVETDGPTLVYAARYGEPRLAIFGRDPQLRLPVMFTALAERLTVSSKPGDAFASVFYRRPDGARPARFLTRPGLVEFALRLAGEGRNQEAPGDVPGSAQGRLDFTFADVVAVLQTMAARDLLVAGPPPSEGAVAFLLEEPPAAQERLLIDEATPDAQRPVAAR